MGTGKATVWAPGTIGNVGPGFDVLGLAVEGLGDVVTVELHHGPARVDHVEGRDAHLVPLEPDANVAAIAARAWLKRAGDRREPILSIRKGLPLAGGLGGSAASSVGGALAAALAAGHTPDPEQLMAASLEGEGAVSGRHLDNLAPCVLGGLTLVLDGEAMDVVRLPVHDGWWVALVTPSVRVETKAARGMLPPQWETAGWIAQVAHTSALTYALQTGDAALTRRALRDGFAEPRRAGLIPHFHDVKQAALEAGGAGCSISGSGPTLFALALDEDTAWKCAHAMQQGFAEVASTAHVGRVARQGAHAHETASIA